MKRHILFLPVLAACLFITACSVAPGCRIEGAVKDTSFEGATVYLKDVYQRSKVYDSVRIVQGKFHFSDSADVTVPYLRLLSLPAHGEGSYDLPVVIENGTVTAALGEIVCTSGTGLNDRLQDFLLGIDRFLESMYGNKELDEEGMKARLSEFLQGYITTNADNIVGVYIYRSYRPLLSEEAIQALLGRNPWLKGQVEN